MLAAELAARFAARFPEATCVENGPASVRVDLPVTDWLTAAIFGRDEVGCTYFDWLSAVDDEGAGFAVVLHVWSVAQRHHAFLRARVPRNQAELPTLTGVYRGASWHEREVAEMFGLVFAGHPDPRPLLLPDGFDGHPLRKDFVLASRVAKPWPGVKEPGESDADLDRPGARHRRRVRPPGAPSAEEWRESAGSTNLSESGRAICQPDTDNLEGAG